MQSYVAIFQCKLVYLHSDRTMYINQAKNNSKLQIKRGSNKNITGHVMYSNISIG